MRLSIFTKTPGPGQIRNSNSYSMAALALQAGAEVQVFPRLADSPAVLRQALSEAAAGNDLVLTSGGVSLGDYDFLQKVIAALPGGEIRFWQVRMKPGKPLLYSRINGVPGAGSARQPGVYHGRL